MKEEVKRVGGYRVRLTPNMTARFEALAERLGMAPSTLAAFALGEFVKRHEDNARVQQIAVIDAVRQFAKGVDFEALSEAMQAANTTMLKHQAKGD